MYANAYILSSMKKFDVTPIRNRLTEALNDSDRSMRSVSMGAGCGPSYLSGILTEGKDPSVGRLAAICKELDVSLYYIISGIEISTETEEFMYLLDSRSKSRDALRHLLDAE